MIISGNARLAGVAGWPVSHSLSPRLHGYWLQEYEVDGAYVPLPIRPEYFEATLRSLPHLGFVGLNVTVPHKEAAFRAVDEADEAAARLGAVNTIVIDGDRLLGSNTDGEGFLANLRDRAPGWDPAAGPAVVIGAGGAGRAVIGALQSAGVPEIRLVNRTRERAEAVARELGGTIAVHDWETRNAALRGTALLVNATSLGMVGQPALELSLEALPASALVNDIVYTPLETELLAAARAHGNPVVDGLGMLLHQARAGFHRWFGVDPVVDDRLRRFILDVLAARESK